MSRQLVQTLVQLHLHCVQLLPTKLHLLRMLELEIIGMRSISGLDVGIGSRRTGESRQMLLHLLRLHLHVMGLLLQLLGLVPLHGAPATQVREFVHEALDDALAEL